MEKIYLLLSSASKMEEQLGIQTEIIAAELMCEAGERNHDRIESALLKAAEIRYDIQGVLASHNNQVLANSHIPPHERQADEKISEVAAGLEFDAIRYRFTSWGKALADIQFLSGWRGAPLLTEPTPRSNAGWQQAVTLEAVIQALHRVINPHKQSNEARGLGCFEDIALPPLVFGNLVQAAFRLGLAQHRDNPLAFLDVGCGSGMKVLQAAQLFSISHGLEYDSGYVSAAEAMLSVAGGSGTAVFHADARSFDQYGNYDVIYFYRPMRDESGLIQIEEQILATARPGTILVNHWPGFADRAHVADRAHEYGMALVEDGIFVTDCTSVRAAQLRTLAKMIITFPMALPPLEDPRAGYLRPIMNVARHLGYGRT